MSRILMAALISLVVLAGCNMPRRTALNDEEISTDAIKLTAEARMTPVSNEKLIAPGTPGAMSASTIQASPDAKIQPGSVTSTAIACDLAAPGVPMDVTVPDDSVLRPGEAFTKTWRLENHGSCAWTRDYAVALFSGEAMDAPEELVLPTIVLPGESVDISIDMVAPGRAGTYQGNWKLRKPDGGWLGIGPEGNSPFWVRIQVVDEDVDDASLSLETPASSESHANGLALLYVGDRLDLDRRQINPRDRADLILFKDLDGKYYILMENGAGFTSFGNIEPSMQNCKEAVLESETLSLDGVGEGTFLCFRTGEGIYGRASVVGFNGEKGYLGLEYMLWLEP